MRTRLIVLASAAVVAVGAGIAGAVQFGVPDGGEHPYVGLMVAHQDGQPLWRCTGTLIAPSLFLTAGHCVGREDPAGAVIPDRVEIWFGEHVDTDQAYVAVAGGGTGCSGFVPAGSGHPCIGEAGGRPVAHEAWNGLMAMPDTHDIGMVVLDEPVTDKGYGVLADVGTLDGLAKRRGLREMSVEVVGYGLQGVKPVLSQDKDKLKASATIVSLGSAFTDGYNVRISSGPGRGNGPGGICFGDSGGPIFYQGEIVAVSSFLLNANCKGSGYGYRTDTPWSGAFVGAFSG